MKQGELTDADLVKVFGKELLSRMSWGLMYNMLRVCVCVCVCVIMIVFWVGGGTGEETEYV